MQTNVFHSFMSSMLNSLSTIQRDFEENKTFPDTSAMAHSLKCLSVQVENLRMSLVSDYGKKK